jgi:K+-sensing histidine kinase KdpD
VPGTEDATEVDRRLQELDALRRRVLNVIPHALRTPITTFRGLAEALPAASEAEIREQIAPALRRLAAQAEHLLDDMLIAAGYTTALPTGALESTPVGDTARAVWADIATDEPLRIDGAGGAEVLAPAGSLFKMLVHLLDNAAKYGESPARIEVTQAGERVIIDVITGGPAVTDLAMLREPFYRGESAVMSTAGLGVGLTVAAALAEQAGGSLSVAAGGAGGLVVTIELAAP